MAYLKKMVNFFFYGEIPPTLSLLWERIYIYRYLVIFDGHHPLLFPLSSPSTSLWRLTIANKNTIPWSFHQWPNYGRLNRKRKKIANAPGSWICEVFWRHPHSTFHSIKSSLDHKQWAAGHTLYEILWLRKLCICLDSEPYTAPFSLVGGHCN